MPSAAALTELGTGDFLSEIEALLTIYASAMDADVVQLPGRRDLMRRHSGHRSFQALAARAEPAGPIVGFAYGFHGQSGQWWYDAVWSALVSAVGAPQAAHWLADCVEIAEVHVEPLHQRRGIGTQLLLEFTGSRPERTAVLSTPDRDTTARRLYRRMGFVDLLSGYSFPGGSPPYAVMGALLPLRDPVATATASRSASPSIW